MFGQMDSSPPKHWWWWQWLLSTNTNCSCFYLLYIVLLFLVDYRVFLNTVIMKLKRSRIVFRVYTEPYLARILSVNFSENTESNAQWYFGLTWRRRYITASETVGQCNFCPTTEGDGVSVTNHTDGSVSQKQRGKRGHYCRQYRPLFRCAFAVFFYICIAM